MKQSPLTHQPRPEVFKQKIVQLYEALFKDDEDGDLSDGFWAELFALKPNRRALRQMLDEATPSALLERDSWTRQLFTRAVSALKMPHGVAESHALDTLSTFLVAVLVKKYTNPSSDIITVLAGLHQIDIVFPDFVGALESIVRSGQSLESRRKAVEVALAVSAGAYQTSLLTYFIQRDMFPAIMKFIQEAESADMRIKAFILLGLLANYNKFEFQNPYQLRLSDFVNEGAIQKIIRSVGHACQKLRTQYLAVQDDLPQGWTFTSTLSILGLGAMAPRGRQDKNPVHDSETVKRMFANLPGGEAAVLLATYDFAYANKLFCFNFVTLSSGKGEEQPFAAFISLTSYLLQHAHLSSRTTLYCHLSLMIFRLLIEDPVLCKRMCSETSKVPIRLCRQRQPYLPLVQNERVPATAILDTMIDCINHNLRRRLDIELYTLCVGILLRIIGYMSRSRTRLQYHWNELFRSLLSLIRFLNTYANDVGGLLHIDTLLDHVVNLIALGLSSGEAFLPTPSAYDDLFYKVVESGDVLVGFRDTYKLAKRPSNSIETLVNVSKHYKEMLAESGGAKTAKLSASNLTSLQVADVIKHGYETLSIQAKEGLDSWEKYREADERTLLKKMARAAVGDVRVLVAE